MSVVSTAALLGWILALGLGLAALELRRRIELVAQAEHELRGPLTALALTLESLGRTCPDRHRARVLRSELGRLRLALEDLHAARDGHRASPRVEPLAVEELVRTAAAAWEEPAKRHGGGVSLDWAAGAATVPADRSRVSQALSNVLANAVEHGGGRVEVIGSTVPGGVRVEVRDAGPGFGSRSPSARADGRGRGLTVARQAVREVGGEVTVLARESGGAVVIDLPTVGR